MLVWRRKDEEELRELYVMDTVSTHADEGFLLMGPSQQPKLRLHTEFTSKTSHLQQHQENKLFNNSSRL